MRGSFGELDDLLRGELTRPEQLSKADIRINWPKMAVLVVLLAMVHGLCMDSFSILRNAKPGTIDRGLLQCEDSISPFRKTRGVEFAVWDRPTEEFDTSVKDLWERKIASLNIRPRNLPLEPESND